MLLYSKFYEILYCLAIGFTCSFCESEKNIIWLTWVMYIDVRIQPKPIIVTSNNYVPQIDQRISFLWYFCIDKMSRLAKTRVWNISFFYAGLHFTPKNFHFLLASQILYVSLFSCFVRRKFVFFTEIIKNKIFNPVHARNWFWIRTNRQDETKMPEKS